MARKAASKPRVKIPDPRTIVPALLDPMVIYGVQDFVDGVTKQLTDHPQFENPRSPSQMDQAIIAEISKTGTLLEPVKVFWTGNNEVVLMDGKTRITGIAYYLKENPDARGVLQVPIMRVVAPEDEIRLLMLKYNLEDTKRPLRTHDIVKYVRKLKAQGVSTASMQKILDPAGVRGKGYVSALEQIVEGNPDVVKAYEENQIEYTTARFLAKLPFEEQKAKLDNVLTMKRESPQTSEAEIRKLAEIKKPNRGTQVFDVVFDYMFDEILVKYEPYLNYNNQELAQKLNRVNHRVEQLLKKEGILEEYQEVQRIEQVRHDFQVFMWMVKQGGVSVEDQKAFVESQMSEEQKRVITEIRQQRGEEVEVVEKPKRGRPRKES